MPNAATATFSGNATATALLDNSADSSHVQAIHGYG